DLFLPSYPIFTLFSSYTMIALTLINNMKVLARHWMVTTHLGQTNLNPIHQDPNLLNPTHSDPINSSWVAIVFPLIAILPAMIVSLFTEDVASIVSYVGSYAGGLIQYVFPCLLVHYSRRQVQTIH